MEKSKTKFEEIAVCRWLVTTAVILIIVGSIMLGKGFYKKNNYSSYAYTNAYVGGDAYNYIINSGYFVGYACIAGACYVSAVLTVCTSLIVYTQERKRVDEILEIAFRDVIVKHEEEILHQQEVERLEAQKQSEHNALLEKRREANERMNSGLIPTSEINRLRKLIDEIDEELENM